MTAGPLATILSRPRTVMTAMVVALLAGIYTYVTIPKEADPDIDVPVFYVSVYHEGISPEDAVRLLVKPMETHLRGLEGLKEITTIASQSHAGAILEFKSGIEHSEASADLREKLDKVKPELPPDAEEPDISEINFSLFPTIVVAISGDVPERTLYSHARRLKDNIEAIPNVLEAKLTGHREEMLEVIIDPAKLEAYNITQEHLVSVVSRNNKLIAAGFMDTGQGSFNIKVPGLFETAEDVYSIPLISSADGIVTLRDVADIRRTFKDRTSYSRFNGRPSINIEVVKRLGSNIIETNKQVRKTVATFTASWPQVVKVDFALDQSKFIHEVLGSLQSAIMTAIALVMIVVVAALGPRSALMVGIAIPSSFMLGFLIIGLAGMTVNMMLMFGMVLTVGILVDGAIVIVEYADRKVAEGLSRRDAYIMSAKRMLWPIVSSTATTLAAFLPLLLWPGVSGEFMSYLPITVIFVLGASLVTAMIFLPVLGRWLGRKKIPETEKLAATHLSSGASVDYSDIRGAVGIYVRFLQTIVNWPLLVIITAAVIMGAIVFLFTKFAKGVEFFVDTEPEQAIVFVSARGNLSAEDKLVLVRKVEREIFAVGGYKAVLTSVTGKGSGPSDFSGAGVDTPVDQIGQGIIELKDFTKRRPGKEILHDIRERTNKIPGIVVEVRKREDGPPTGKDVRLQIGGNERLIVEQVTRRVRRHFENMEGLRDIEDTTPLPGIEWVLDVDRKEAGRFGADVTSVGAMIQLVTNGLLIGTYRPDDSEDEVDIRLRFPGADRSIDQLDQLRVIGEQGQVPLVNFVNRQARPLVSSITRLDGSFSMSVKANTVEGILPDSKIGEIDAWLKSQEWPRGIEFRFRGADEEQREAGAFLGKAMVAALFIMFIILLTQFDSFYQTFITLSTIVMSMVGVLLGMLITGQTFSIIMTGTGVIALAGIVVNNSIVLIDTYNHLRYDVGLRGVDAVLKASAQRLRPVLLTTVTTICGLLPMALQINMDFINRYIQIGSITSIWWVQLSTAVIFGLGFATMLTLIITPTLLAMPTVYKDAFRRRAARKT